MVIQVFSPFHHYTSFSAPGFPEEFGYSDILYDPDIPDMVKQLVIKDHVVLSPVLSDLFSNAISLKA